LSSVISYSHPQSLAEALNLLAADIYQPIAGGTDLIPQLRFATPVRLLDVGGLGLNVIKDDGDYLEIGAGCSHTLTAENDLVHRYAPLLGIASSMVGSCQIRNRGTVGGNIVNASPCADTVPALLIYDAEVVLESSSGQRTMKLADFTTRPYVTDRKPNELLRAIRCKKNRNTTGHSYIKLGRRQAVNISRMTVAASLGIEDEIIKDARISGGSVFPVTSRMTELENILSGQKLTSKLIDEAGKFAAELMIKQSGYRWSTPYKEPVLTGLYNGKAANSCLILAAQIDGAEIWTIEGVTLSAYDELHPIQRAFIECDAVHCGFCTPGMIMATLALLLKTTTPSDDEIKTALAGNLCRCTGYIQIIEAVRQAAGMLSEKDLAKFRPSS
jgi:xanthine dehydrogenase iron-sulfur cluster and FAD-binding subunit A